MVFARRCRGIEELDFRIDVAKRDRTVRRTLVTAEYAIPEERPQELGGGTGGSFSYSVRNTEIGRPQRIVPPSQALPFRQLERELNRQLQGEGSTLPGG
jgi:hypothetical protein